MESYQYHISQGVPKRCSATKKPCPLGGAHFKTEDEARFYLEAKEVKRNGGSFTESFSKERMSSIFHRASPMTYAVNIDDQLISEDGREWIVVSKFYGRTDGRDHTLPTIGIASVIDGEEVLIDPYGDESYTVKDFRLPTPEPVYLDGSPIRDSEKFRDLPEGKHVFSQVSLQSIQVNAGKDGEAHSRYLITQKPLEGYFSKSVKLDVSNALWKQAGRDPALWEMKSEEEQMRIFERNNNQYPKLAADNTGDEVRIYGYDRQGQQYLISRDPLSPKDICVYQP